MTKKAVRELIDLQATATLRGEIDDPSLAESIFSDSNIAEFWFYELDPNKWEGTLEIYFDENEEVTGTNCGFA